MSPGNSNPGSEKFGAARKPVGGILKTVKKTGKLVRNWFDQQDPTLSFKRSFSQTHLYALDFRPVPENPYRHPSA